MKKLLILLSIILLSMTGCKCDCSYEESKSFSQIEPKYKNTLFVDYNVQKDKWINELLNNPDKEIKKTVHYDNSEYYEIYSNNVKIQLVYSPTTPFVPYEGKQRRNYISGITYEGKHILLDPDNLAKENRINTTTRDRIISICRNYE